MTIEIGDMKFHGYRPSSEEWLRYQDDRVRGVEIARRHIDGWENIRECDLIAGGSDEIVPFNSEVFSELIADRVDIGGYIIIKFREALDREFVKMDELQKNLTAGSSTSKSKNTRKQPDQ